MQRDTSTKVLDIKDSVSPPRLHNKSAIIPDRLFNQLVDETASTIDDFVLKAFGINGNGRESIQCFLSMIGEHPALGSPGSTSIPGLLLLYTVCRVIKPELIVESGVWIGSSLYTLRKACPNARIVGFDLDLSRLAFTDDSIELFEDEWSNCKLAIAGENNLCYFDDHINNCKRLKEASERGFRYAIFDDAPDVGNIHHYRYPGVPTVPMFWNNRLEPGDRIIWQQENSKRIIQYEHNQENEHGLDRNVIQAVHRFPEIPNLFNASVGDKYLVVLRRKENR
ncbi:MULTISPECIES: hypothetical protein [unclassified Thiocapsa]|uniref:hypothetical protein n=1 Tax=unclassified Thiocapsa TaxID=2641286 RepID=UPI0035B02D52